MYILAIDTSCAVSTVAVTADDKLLAEITLNLGNTHSETLLPTIADVLEKTSLTLDDISIFATTLGPGSFTGIRIGVSTIKGLAFGKGRVCRGVSSLAALAEAAPSGALICPVLNARHDSVYTALFRREKNAMLRLRNDDILSLDELVAILAGYDEPIYIVGDHCEETKNALPCSVNAITLPRLDMPSAYYVALAAIRCNESIDDSALAPIYLRKSQAEQEREARLKQNNN